MSITADIGDRQPAAATMTPARANLYAAGSFGTGLFATVPSVLLLYFCTEVLHIAPAIAGLVILVPKIWSVAWDPLVGSYVDRTGNRDHVLIAGLLGLTISFIAVFSPPELAMPALVAWTAVAYFALTSSLALFAVPYVAFPARLAITRSARSDLIGRRVMMVSVGVMAGAAAAPALVAVAGGGRPGYVAMACVLAAVALVAMALPLGVIRRHPARASGTAVPGLFAGVRAACANRRYAMLVAVLLLVQAASGAMLAAVPYLVTRNFGRSEADIGLALGVLTGATILTTVPWSRLPRKLGERRTMILCLVATMAASALMGGAALAGAGWPPALAAMALLGFTVAGLQVLVFALAANVISETAPSIETMLTGVWTAADKIGLAVGAALVAGALALAGADQGMALAWFLVLCPALLFGCAMPLVRAAVGPDPDEHRIVG